MSDAATTETVSTPSAEAQAVQMFRDANAQTDVAPAEPAATPAVPVPTEVAPPAAPADDVSELWAKLEARKAERAAKQGAAPDVVSQLQAKIDALEAKLSHPPIHVPQDFPALVRQHGEVEAMRMVGIDPLEFFGRFKQVAKDPAAIQRQQNELEHANRMKELAEQQAKLGKTLEQREADDRAKADREMWNSYVRMVETPESGTPLLAKLPVLERVERTQKKIGWLQSNGYPLDEIDDTQLAKLVEKDLRSLKDLLAGTDAGATTTTHVPATDGARPPTSSATLSNDLASQTTGGERLLSEKERTAQAIAVLQRGE